MPGPRFRRCVAEEQEKLRLAVQTARAKLAHGLCGLAGLDELRRCLLERLRGLHPQVISCSDCETTPAVGYTLKRGNRDVFVCRRLFTAPQERVDAVLFHELVHACGGDELDAEGLEGQCFGGQGATPPGSSDFRLFQRLPLQSGYHVGNYLMWDPLTGEVFIRAPGDTPGAALDVKFPRPTTSEDQNPD